MSQNSQHQCDQNYKNYSFQNNSIKQFATQPFFIQNQSIDFSLQDLNSLQIQQQSIQIYNNPNQSRRFKKLRRNRNKNKIFQIDSKQPSVEEIKQNNGPCIIDIQPIPQGYAINIDNNNQINPIIPQNDIMMQLQNVLNLNQPDKQKSLQSKSMQMNQMSEQIQKRIQTLTSHSKMSQKQKQQFKQVVNIAREYQNAELEDDQVMQIPKAIGQLAIKTPFLIQQPKQKQICQQFLMIGYFDIIGNDEKKLNIKLLVKSGIKQRIAQFIKQQITKTDHEFGYNVQILKIISSGWIWDNVLPFMAEKIYKHDKLQIKLLPERRNMDQVKLTKKELFIILAQMFYGFLPKQIATFDLPITFGEIMTLGQNDTAVLVQNNTNKLKCILHYFSAILRDKKDTFQNSTQFVVFQRFRIALKAKALFPSNQFQRVQYSKLKLTDHFSTAVVRHGNQYLKQTSLFLTHQNLCRQSGEQSYQMNYLMQQTYKLMYSKPQLFALRFLTPRLDLGEAIIIHGLQQFSKCSWSSPKINNQNGQQMDEQYENRKFNCHGLFMENTELDSYGKRKGTVILIMSKLLFGQSFLKNQQMKNIRINQNYRFGQLKIEIETLFSAFQGRKIYCSEEERILISQRHIKFIQQDCKWLYFMVVWIASSLSKTKVVFQFEKHEDRDEALSLMNEISGWSIERVVSALSEYSETLLQAHQNWLRYIQKLNLNSVEHDWNTNTQQRQQLFLNQAQLQNKQRAINMTFIDFMKNLYL